MSMIDDTCTEACEAMPDCTVCKRRKHPRGRDPGVYGASGYCEHECPGNSEPPHAGHLWPGELRRWREEQAEAKEQP
jgi:hypothetical protein